MSSALPTSRVSARTVRRLAPPLVAFGEFVDGYDLLVMSTALIFLTPAFALTAADKGVLGAASFVALCEKLRQKYGERFAPPKIVMELASARESFYRRFAGRTNRVA